MKLISFGDYKGFKIDGTVPMSPLSDKTKDFHLKRACWLTAQVESGGKYGCAISYDGTGCTSGLHQAVSLYPKEVWEVDNCTEDDQGPLWKIVRCIMNTDRGVADPLIIRLVAAGWTLEADGKLRKKSEGFPSGKEMRREINGNVHGVTPEFGPDHDRAQAWVESFAKVFSDPATFAIQDASGEEFILKRAARAQTSSGTIQKVLYDNKDIATITVDGLGEALDLALCVFWSHSVNAPGEALRCLQKALKRYGTPIVQPEASKTLSLILMRELGNSNYGRWCHDIRGGRYDRTRMFAKNSGLWPAELFFTGSLMSADF